MDTRSKMPNRYRRALLEILRRRVIDWDMYEPTQETFPHLFGFKMTTYINRFVAGDQHWESIFRARNKEIGYTLNKRTNKPKVSMTVRTDELVKAYITKRFIPYLFKSGRYEEFLNILQKDSDRYETFTQYADSELLKILNS